MKRAHDTLNEEFDDTMENYIRQNPSIETEDVAAKDYEELCKDHRQILIAQNQDLMKLGTILKKDPFYLQILTKTNKQGTAEDFDDHKVTLYAVTKTRFVFYRLIR